MPRELEPLSELESRTNKSTPFLGGDIRTARPRGSSAASDSYGPGQHDCEIAIMNVIDQIEAEMSKDAASLPTLHVGDDVEVKYLIKEGDKERIQPFKGTIIAIKGRGIRRSMIVRRIVQGEGVERVFPLHSPRVKDVVVTRRSKARKAKLYYLRDRTGKQTRLKELLGEKVRLWREAEKARRASQVVTAEPSAE